MFDDGDVVRIEYVGRVQDTGEVFDLTSEEIAEEEGYDTEQFDLGPVTVLLGADHVIEGLEDAVREMDAGDAETVTVPAEKAFGDRDSDAIETFSTQAFEEYDVTPRRGLVVEIDGRRGKILSTTSDRVKVDFNHPLAEATAAVLEYYGLDEMDVEVSVDGGTVTVDLPDEIDNADLADQLRDEVGRVNGVDAVEIT
ncbi:MAG: peptidylprolyl isomerase [Candidatus Nanohaloarchaea archaeon]